MVFVKVVFLWHIKFIFLDYIFQTHNYIFLYIIKRFNYNVINYIN